MDLSELFKVCLDILPVECILVAPMDQVCQMRVEVNDVEEWKDGESNEPKDWDEYASTKSDVGEGVVLSDA